MFTYITKTDTILAMPSKNIFQKNLPTTVIFNGLNFLGERFVEDILESGGNILLLDNISKKNNENLRKIKEYKEKISKGEVRTIDINSAFDVKEVLRKCTNINFALFMANFEYQEEIDMQKNLNLLEDFFEIVKEYESKSAVTININKSERSAFNEYQEAVEKKVLKEVHSSKCALIRIANVYGERLDEFINNPINTAVESIRNKENIKINNENSFFYYVYVDDALSGIANVLFSNKEGDFTVSNKEDISNISLAFRISDITGFPVINAEPRERKLEDRIKNPINMPDDWKPETIFEDGLKKTILAKISNQIKNNTEIKSLENITIPDEENNEMLNEFKKSREDRKFDITNFNKLKENYLKQEDLKFENKRKDKKIREGKNHKFFILIYIITIIFIIIIIYIADILLNYYDLNSNIKSESSSISQETISSQTQNNIVKESQNLGNALKYLKPILKFNSTYNQIEESIVWDIQLQKDISSYYNDQDSINSFKDNLSLNNNISNLTDKYNLNLKSKLSNIENNILNLSQAENNGLYSNTLYLTRNLISVSQNLDNEYSLAIKTLSGSKAYTIVLYNSPTIQTGNIDILQYEFIEINNGNITKTIYSTNSGDLNQTSGTSNPTNKAIEISTLVNKAFNVKNDGVLFINQSVYSQLKSLSSENAPLQAILSVKNRPQIFELINSQIGKNIFIYFTSGQLSSINNPL